MKVELFLFAGDFQSTRRETAGSLNLLSVYAVTLKVVSASHNVVHYSCLLTLTASCRTSNNLVIYCFRSHPARPLTYGMNPSIYWLIQFPNVELIHEVAC